MIGAAVTNPPAPAPSAMGAIELPYLLVSDIACAVEDGSLVLPSLWVKDLAAHTAYIRRLSLAAPVCEAGDIANAGSLPLSSLGDRSHLTSLPDARSIPAALATLPLTAIRLWSAIGRAQIVHCGVAGWPFPLGWLAAAIARVRGRFLIVLVESAPWRLHPGEMAGAKRRFRARLFEFMARWCLRRADLAIATQPEYARSLGRDDAHILHASWIDDDRVLSEAAASAAWRARLADPRRPLRIAFAGRLDEEKGVRVLLAAATDQALRERAVEFDVIGDGPLRAPCEDAARVLPTIKVRGAIPYDHRFFAALAEADLVVVPSLGDEQPRVVYDAYSQALPVLASDTPGLRACVAEGVEGVFVKPGDARALAAAIAGLDRSRLRDMGLAALRRGRQFTHTVMHRRRCELILAEVARRGLTP